MLGDVDGGKTGLAEHLECLFGKPCALVHIRGVGCNLLLGEVTEHDAELVVFVRELEQVERRVAELCHRSGPFWLMESVPARERKGQGQRRR